MPAQIKARVAGPFPAERHQTYPTPLRVTNGEISACRMRRYELIGAPLPDVGWTLGGTTWPAHARPGCWFHAFSERGAKRAREKRLRRVIMTS